MMRYDMQINHLPQGMSQQLKIRTHPAEVLVDRRNVMNYYHNINLMIISIKVYYIFTTNDKSRHL